KSPAWTCWSLVDSARGKPERRLPPAGRAGRIHVDLPGPATRLPLSRAGLFSKTGPPGQIRSWYACRDGRRLRLPAALSRTSFVAQTRSGTSGNRQTLARSAVLDSSGQTIVLLTGSPCVMRGLVAGGRRFPGATHNDVRNTR